MKRFKDTFELFSIDVRRLRNGNKLRLTFEKEHSLGLEKKLIEFRGEFVLLQLTPDIPPESAANVFEISGKFEVFDIKCRHLRNGNKMSLILEQLYEKEKEMQFVSIRFQNVFVGMEPVERELPFPKDDNEPLPEELNVDVDGIAKDLPDIKRKKARAR